MNHFIFIEVINLEKKLYKSNSILIESKNKQKIVENKIKFRLLD